MRGRARLSAFHPEPAPAASATALTPPDLRKRHPIEDDPGSSAAALADTDRKLAVIDQRAADSDQAASDVDQLASIAEQAQSDAAQLADDRANVQGDAASRERYLVARATRARASRERHAIQLDRFRAADDREAPAVARDAVAARRDERARRRDDRAIAIEDAIARHDPVAAGAMRQLRLQGARDRAAAARDRARAARERSAAGRERARLEEELQTAHLDDLTGAYRREMGWLALDHEIERARRGDGRFVLAFIDLDDLKGVNDREGHAAGDRALRVVVVAIRSNLRSFDPVLRYGGDEFVAGLGGMAMDEVEDRFATIQDRLREGMGISISVGLAALNGDESIDELTARADRELYRRRAGRWPSTRQAGQRGELTG